MINKPKNLVSIDIARAIAALGVYTYHQHLGFLLSKYTGLKWLNNLDTFGSTYAVPLFFLISGYCIHSANIKYLKTNQSLPIWTYYKRRFTRIYPPYVIAVLFSIVVNIVTKYNEPTTAVDILAHLALLQAFTVKYFNSINVVLWTISVETAFYLIYPLFYYLRIKYNLNYALLFTFLISCISIGVLFTQVEITLPQRYFVLNLWFAWCAGAYLADKKNLNEADLKAPIYKVLYALIAVASVTLKIFYNYKVVITDYQFDILIWTLPLMWLISLEDWFRAKKSYVIKILSAIGLSSYSLYLFHEPLIALKNFASHYFLPDKLQTAGVFLGILIIPVITWFNYVFIEKPFMRQKKTALVTIE